MTVSSGWNSREVSLNGLLIGVTVSTPGSAANRSSRTGSPRADLADDRDDDVVGADVVVRGQALGQDLALDAEDLGLGGAGGHHDEHRAAVSSSVGRPNKKAEVSPLPRSPGTTRAPGLADREPSCRALKVEEVAHA